MGAENGNIKFKLFCKISDIPITCKKITRGLPKIRRHADDRAPTIETIQKICEYPDKRIKVIVYPMTSSGMERFQPVERQGKMVEAKIIVYSGEDDEYFSFITLEAYYEL